jgi:pSer/pThr/pTyr-binding forkhead associated (FHA) protein
MSAIASSSNISSDSKWTTLSGPQKGSSQELTKALVVLGRSSDCDIVINDPKCSRRHAQVEVTPNGFEIQILSESNAMKINGRETQSTTIKDGDIITIGDTDIRFNTTNTKFRTKETSAPRSSLGWTPQIVTHPAPQAVSPSPYQYPAQPAPTPRSSKRSKPKSNNSRVYIYGGIVLVGIWLFTGGTIKKKKEITIRTQEQIDQDIESAKKLQEAAEELRKQSNQNSSPEMRQAQENYVKGFRDFRKGQYERALESFQACLSLAPEHVLCNRYLRLSQRKFSELIQYHMVLGRKYRDQEQYMACRAAFRNVMFMVKDFSSPIFKEAKANFDACNSFVEGNF